MVTSFVKQKLYGTKVWRKMAIERSLVSTLVVRKALLVGKTFFEIFMSKVQKKSI